MEAPPAAAALSGADKEKLREKLALLRREYSETVIRLRRARRAERARSHGRRERSPPAGSRGERGAPGESRGERGAPGESWGERGASGSRDSTSPSADRGGPSQLQTETCSEADTEKTTSVTVKHVPEFPSDEVSPQDSSRAESFQASQENVCCGIIRPVPVEKKPQTSRGRMKLRRQTKERESVHDVHLISAGEMMKNQTASAEELQSPVFRHSSLLHAEEPAQRAPEAVLVQGERNSFTPDAALGLVQDVLEGSVTAGEPELSPHALRDSRDVWQPESSRAVATPDRHEPCSQQGDSVLLDPRGDGGEESPSIIKQPEGQSLCEDQGELRGLLDLMSENETLPDSRNNTITEESKNHEGHQSDTNTLNPCPAVKALDTAEELLESQQLQIQSRLSPADKALAPEGALGSCTVVEGLLFPVEYYVRTTRRMSSCQRKVDLDAVILSQLGRSKKGQRSKCKQKDAHPNEPSQERAEGDLEPGVGPFPFLGEENDQANSGSSQKSLPASSSSSSTSLESISQKSITSTRQEQRQSQRKQKGRRKSACKAPVHPVSQELIESQDPTMASESSALLSNENQSEKENCDANLERSSSDERRLCGAAALGSAGAGVAGATEAAGADPPPGGSQVPGKCHKAPLERVQNPLHSSSPLSPGSDTFASPVGDVEANAPVCQGDKHPVQRVKRRRGAEQLPGVSVPLRRSQRCSARHRPQAGSAEDSSRGCSSPRGSQGPAALGLPAVDLDTRGSLFSFRSLQWLVPKLGIRDFHLPNEEFGVLKLEKLKSSPVNDLEDFVSGDGVAPEDTPDAQMKPKEKCLKSNLILPSKTGLPELPCMESLTSKKELSTHELLFTPMGTVLAEAPTHPESEISSSIFPAVGATPGVLPSVHTEVFPDTPSVPALPVTSPSPRGAAAQVLGDVALHPDSCAAGAARNQEEQGTALPSAAERGPENKSDETVSLEKHQQPENKEQESCRASPEQRKDAAEQLTPVLPDGPREESLQLVSELKDSSCSGAVDVSTVWWAAAGCRELRVVTACESAVSLWEPRAPACWARVYTWHLREIPVIQIVPLPDTCNLVCVALGELEIGEIRLLLYSSETDSFKYSLVKTGNIKAVAGLKDWRLVSSSRTMQEQQVEVVSLSETGGSKDRQTLMPPEETVTAFAEVEGMREALVGTTAGNSVVVWNLKTGQLLRKMHVGYSYPASICHRAYSDSGLLFVALSHPHAKESESCGSPAFRVVAFNPRTARSAGAMLSCLPPGPAGRYLEGDVWDTAGAAVLTSGAVAVWDLLRGRCTAVLPPGPAGHWALARWATGGAGLLAGRRDGTVRLYRYRPPQPGAA
ncbi:partner and localizer of BRCA2 isoform X6 [Vidua macroura]|uniref:partner and localizer of BRCA2 isoform X6 n=1 Tax=Vidua macroura TaxID=187451 RepID=UPI0023A8F617|nr:partner and localizer of BRCA2 isoform X6 [Vidua macroura]